MNNKLSTGNKEKIIASALKLSLIHGFHNVSINNIKEESGVTTGGIYYHFKNKQDILEQMLDTYFMNLLNEYKNYFDTYPEEDNFIGTLHSFLYSMLGINEDTKKVNFSGDVEIDLKHYYTFLLSVFHNHPEVRHIFYDFSDKMFSIVEEFYARGVKNNELREDISVREMTTNIITITHGFVIVWTRLPELSRKHIVDVIMKLVNDSVKKR